MTQFKLRLNLNSTFNLYYCIAKSQTYYVNFDYKYKLCQTFSFLSY